MRRRLIVAAEHFPLARPFAIARGVRTAIDVLTVRVEEEGAVGWGEGAPYARYGETMESSIAAIERIRPAIEKGVGRDALQTLLPPGAARNAVDCALWDLAAKREGVSVAERLGVEPAPIATALTIGIAAPEAMGRAAAELAHVPLLKVKLDALSITERVRAVRAAAPNARIIVDANESWTADLLQQVLPVLADADVELVEQPLPAGQDAALAAIKSPVPISADESAHVAADIPALAGLYDYVTIKLDKSGGLTEALAMADAAAAAGMGVMTGCMLCTSLSVAPAWFVAMRSSVVDLDGPWWLRADRAGGIALREGRISPPVGLGWGAPYSFRL